MYLSQNVNLLVLTIGLTLLVAVVVLSYRELRARKLKSREASTRLMIGAFDLYRSQDRLKVSFLVEDLYQLYLASHAACGLSLGDNEETFDRFVHTFAYPYLNDRYSLAGLPEQVAAVFREKHQQFFDKPQPA